MVGPRAAGDQGIFSCEVGCTGHGGEWNEPVLVQPQARGMPHLFHVTCSNCS